MASHPAALVVHPPNQPGPLDSVDYAVYAALLRQGVRANETAYVVVDSTRAVQVDLVSWSLLHERLTSEIPGATGLFEDLLRVNRGRSPLSPALLLGRPYHMVSDAELRDVLPLHPEDVERERQGWTAFYERFHQVNGYYELSRPVYDDERRMALVMYSQRCSRLCGSAGYMVLRRRDNGPWKLVMNLESFSDGTENIHEPQ